jgi:hypothetical protein
MIKSRKECFMAVSVYENLASPKATNPLKNVSDSFVSEKAAHNAEYVAMPGRPLRQVEEGKAAVKTLGEPEDTAVQKKKRGYTESFQKSLRELEKGDVVVRTIEEIRAMLGR